MKTRKEIKSVSDIKKNPEIRTEFKKEHHQDFVDFSKIADTYKIPVFEIAKHILITWTKKFKGAPDNAAKMVMLSEVVQSIHGVNQIEMFTDPMQWGNIDTKDDDKMKRGAGRLVKSGVFAASVPIPKRTKAAARKGKARK